MSKSFYSSYKSYLVLGLMAAAAGVYKAASVSKPSNNTALATSGYSQSLDLHSCLKNPSAPECAPSGYSPGHSPDHSYDKALANPQAKESLHLPAFAESSDQKPCEVFPATAEVSAEADLFASRIGRLQKGYHDRSSSSNPHAACANSGSGVMAAKSLPTIGFPHNTCRNDHQNELKQLQSRKAEYYKRYLALSREPACAGLLASVENLALGRSMEQASLQPSFSEGRAAPQREAAASGEAADAEGMR